MIHDVDLYREYAKIFWNEINQIFNMRIPDLNYLPIVFEQLPDRGDMVNVYGFTHTHQNDRTKRNSLFPVVFLRDDCDDDQIKETIRHEIIHYYLGLHYFNYQDKTALFSLMCYLLEGGAYVELDEREAQIYAIAKSPMSIVFSKYKTSRNKKQITTNLGIIMSAVDNASVHLENNFDELKKACRVCLAVSLKGE